MLEIEHCHPLGIPRRVSVGHLTLWTGTAHTTVYLNSYNFIAENTVPTEYAGSYTGKIENSLLFYLSGRKIVFKNTLLNV